ncbi:MAG: hypothetical protein U0452_06935 [Anaerolineae bacterium]
MHITENQRPHAARAGQEAAPKSMVGTCNTESTNDAAAAYLAEHGVTILAWRGMTGPTTMDTSGSCAPSRRITYATWAAN